MYRVLQMTSCGWSPIPGLRLFTFAEWLNTAIDRKCEVEKVTEGTWRVTDPDGNENLVREVVNGSV